MEIRSLTASDDLVAFLDMMLARLDQHRDYEAVQALLATLLRVHTDLILQTFNPEISDDGDEDDQMQLGADGDEAERLKSVLRKLIRAQVAEGRRLNGLLDQCLGTLAFLRGIPMT